VVPKGIVARILKNKLKVIYPLLLTATTAHMASFSEQHIAVLNWHLANDYRDDDDDDDDDSSSSSSSSSSDSDDSEVWETTDEEDDDDSVPVNRPIIIDNSHYMIRGDEGDDMFGVYQIVAPYTFVGTYDEINPEEGVMDRGWANDVAPEDQVVPPYIYEDISSVIDLLLY